MTISTNFDENNPDSPMAPSTAPYAIVPHAADPLPTPVKAIYVGGAGDVVLRGVKGAADVTFKNVPAGATLDVRASHVRATSTATFMVGLA